MVSSVVIDCQKNLNKIFYVRAEVEETGGKVHTGDEEAIVTGVLNHTLAGSNGSLRIHVVGSAYLRVIDLQGTGHGLHHPR